MRILDYRAMTGALALLAACSGNSFSPGQGAGGKGGAGSSDSEAGQAGEADAGGSGHGGSAGEDASGGRSGSGRGGTSSGSAGDPGSAGTGGSESAVDCTTTLGNTSGTLGMEELVEDWTVASVTRLAGDPWLISTDFEQRGFELVLGASAGDPADLGKLGVAARLGVLWAPASSKAARRVACLGAVKASTPYPFSVELRSETAKLLGACPGTPVSGEVTLCSEGHLMCNEPASGTVDGRELDGSGLELSGSSWPGSYAMRGFGKALSVQAFVDGHPPTTQNGNVEEALIITYPEDGEGGAVYCAGAGSTFAWSTPQGTYLSLKNLSKLGDCNGPAGTDQLLLCR